MRRGGRTIALGLDGFRKGWVAVRIDGARPTIAFLPNLDALDSLPFDRAAIDMPLGLGETGLRECDLLARERLRPHASRLFTGARRMLFEAGSHAQANRELVRRGERRISIQLWGLVPKLREADAFTQTHPSCDLRESHPELVFRRLNGGAALVSKHTPEGLAARTALLSDNGFAASLLDEWLNETRMGTGAKADDVLDACACAIAARDHGLGHCLPVEPEYDAHGLAMQIRY